MSWQGLRSGIVSAGAYHANAVHFDGTNDWLNLGADLAENADGKQVLLSVRLKFDPAGDDANQVILRAGTGHFNMRRRPDNKFDFKGSNAAVNHILAFESASEWTSANGWIHVNASANLATGEVWLRINGVDDLAAGPTVTDDEIDFTQTDHFVGANHLGTALFHGDMADVYLNYEASLDLDVAANLLKFSDGDGRPVYLGENGELPTGAAPLELFSGPTDTWHLNDGSGGGFNENGALTDATTSPSD